MILPGRTMTGCTLAGFILTGRTRTGRNLASRNLAGFILTGRTPGIRILTRVRTHTADLSRAVKRKAVCTKR